MRGVIYLPGVLDPFDMEWIRDPLTQYHDLNCYAKSLPSSVEIMFCDRDQILRVQCHRWSKQSWCTGAVLSARVLSIQWHDYVRNNVVCHITSTFLYHQVTTLIGHTACTNGRQTPNKYSLSPHQSSGEKTRRWPCSTWLKNITNDLSFDLGLLETWDAVRNRSFWRLCWLCILQCQCTPRGRPTIRQPGFALPQQQWSLLNRYCTGQGHCGACKKKWKLLDSDQCSCGETQTMSHCWSCLVPRWETRLMCISATQDNSAWPSLSG